MYDYESAIRSDVIEWLEDNEYEFDDSKSLYDTVEDLYDELYSLDEITGNTDWYASERECAMFLADNFDLAYDAIAEFGNDASTIIHNFENRTLARFLDCSIRCYLLYNVIYEVVNEKKSNS